MRKDIERSASSTINYQLVDENISLSSITEPVYKNWHQILVNLHPGKMWQYPRINAVYRGIKSIFE